MPLYYKNKVRECVKLKEDENRIRLVPVLGLL